MSKTMDGYIRVSRKGGRDGETYLSPTLQREAIERWAEYNKVRIAAWHVDEDWSGGASSRPGLDAARARIVAGETGGIVSWKIDRFSRNTVQGLEDLKLLQKHNARLAFTADSLDTNSPTGKMLYTILLAVAESVLDGITAGWLAARSKAYQRGALIERTPLGYERITDRYNEHVGQLVIDPITGPLITRTFEVAAEDGLQAAREHLASVFPERRWETTDARRLLANRAYLGEIKLGDVRRLAHDPLTTPELWHAAQTTARARRSNGDYPLTGYVFCQECQQKLVGQLQAVPGRDKQYRRMRCSNRACKGGTSISADALESWIRDELVKALAIPGFAKLLSPEGLDDAREAVALAERALIRWTNDDRTRDAIGEAAYFAGLEDRTTRRDDARATFDLLAAQAATSELMPTAEQMEQPEHFARALRLALDRVVIRRGRGSISDRVVSFTWQRHELVAGMLAA